MVKSSRNAILARQVELRKQLWPLIDDKDLWLRKERDGWATLPRAMPYLGVIMDNMRKGKPVSDSYLSLWCMVLDEMFITITSPIDMAYQAGFEGERAVRTWRERMKQLKDDGFIDYKAGSAGDITYVLILNPFHVIRRHYELNHPGITERRYTALVARAHAIGAADMTEQLPDSPNERKPAPMVTLDDYDEIPF